ncbi:hypothetical protein E4T47_03947 [Aureobasidium subglaciale]|nr:hypothetical protein E4T47_03947 [Aureobasidium subglaciale]
MYTSIKTLAAAVALPLVAALPLSHRSDAVFDSSKPFTLHTEVVNGTSAFCGQYLTSFHVGAGQSTVVGSKNSSIAIGWDSILQQPLATGGAPAGFAYNISLLEQAPYRSDAPTGYDYVSLGASGAATTGFYFNNNNTLAWSASNSSVAPESFDGNFALCHVNGTSPYFTLGPQYQLLWKTNNASTVSPNCADVKLVAANIA